MNYNPYLYNKTTDNYDWASWKTAVDAYHQTVYETWAATPAAQVYNPPSWTAFKQKPVLYFPSVNLGSFNLVDTPSGNFFPQSNAPLLKVSNQLEIYSNFLANPNAGDISFATSMGTETLGAGQIGPAAGPLPMWWATTYGSFLDPRHATYPLVILTCESRFRTHSGYFDNALLNGDCYRHACWINPADAQSRGISDGDLVRVFSNRGEMVIEAYVTSRIAPGVVNVGHGGWYMADSAPTALNPDGMDRGGAPNIILEDVEPDLMTIGPSLDKGVCDVELFESDYPVPY
jgi:anaerobic selenocysteine-containing dehydrogenase